MASFPIRKWSRYEIPVVTARFLEIVTRALIAWTRFSPLFVSLSFKESQYASIYIWSRHETLTTNIDHTNRRKKRDILQDEQYFFLRYINHSLIFASLVLSPYLKKRRNRKTMNGGGYRLLCEIPREKISFIRWSKYNYGTEGNVYGAEKFQLQVPIYLDVSDVRAW